MDNINSSKNSKTTFPQYKTLVDEYWSSDVAWDRSTFVSYNINGRVWWKHGQRPAVTYFGKIYKNLILIFCWLHKMQLCNRLQPVSKIA